MFKSINPELPEFVPIRANSGKYLFRLFKKQHLYIPTFQETTLRYSEFCKQTKLLSTFALLYLCSIKNIKNIFMKIIIYILFGFFWMLQPHQSFATIGRNAISTHTTTVTNSSKNSKQGAKKVARMSSSEVNFFLFAGLSVLSLIIGLILLNWWLIILGVLGISLIIFFIYLLSHISLH
jgi:hypothetical protein